MSVLFRHVDGDHFSLGVVESVHRGHGHGHLNAVEEDEEDNRHAEQPHPYPRRKEADAIPGCTKLLVPDAKRLQLKYKRVKYKYSPS